MQPSAGSSQQMLKTLRASECLSISPPTTDHIVAGIKADGVEAAIEHILKKFEGVGNIGVPVLALEWFAKQLREGAKGQ
ncbi:Uncharacterised protein [Escherichia coli]|nr:Uncharacterised protein [Escherichia coli]